MSMKKFRAWCKDSLCGDYALDEFKKDRVWASGKQSVACLVRCQDVEDQILLKLKWYDYQ